VDLDSPRGTFLFAVGCCKIANSHTDLTVFLQAGTMFGQVSRFFSGAILATAGARAVAMLACAAGLIGCAAFAAEEPAIVPITVCEILRDPAAYDGKSIAVLGRYSFRESGGRWLGEQNCGPGSAVAVPVLWLMENAKDAPKPPDSFTLDGIELHRKWVAMQQRTSLGKFRFGTSDYDRWAVVYGKLQTRKAGAGDPGEPAERRSAPADLIFRGDGTIVFLALEH
jgi:hypothetical protein